MLKGYEATMDWPWCTYYKELMRVFPDAKVLLSVRDPEEWYESTITTLYSMYKISRYATYGPGSVPAGGGIGVWDDVLRPLRGPRARNRGLRAAQRGGSEACPSRAAAGVRGEGGVGPAVRVPRCGSARGVAVPTPERVRHDLEPPDKKEQASETPQGRRDSARGRELQDVQSVPVTAP